MNNQTVSNFFQKVAEFEAKKQTSLEKGHPALARLLEVAKRDTGQSMTVRRVLLGLYNGHRFPFDLTELRGLDTELFDDCMAVITMDACATIQEIHQYIPNGGRLFESWAQEFKQ